MLSAEELAEKLIEYYEKQSKNHGEYFRGWQDAIEALATEFGIDLEQGVQSYNFINCKVCGEGMLTPHFTNECDCGTLYNFAGQMLRPQSDWCQEEWQGDDY